MNYTELLAREFRLVLEADHRQYLLQLEEDHRQLLLDLGSEFKLRPPMLLPELPPPDMIHTGGYPDKFYSELLFNDPPATDYLSFNPHDSLWNSLSPLNPDFLKDRDDMREEINKDYDEFERDVLFRDVNWSAYSSETESSVLIKQEKEDDCMKRLVSYGIDGTIIPIEEGRVASVEDRSVKDEEESYRSEVIRPYTPNVDHSYHLVPTAIDLGIVKSEEDERNVDIWNKTEELEQFHPAPVALAPRKNLRRNIRSSKSKSVSISKAVNVALKRTKSQVSPRRQKLKNSVETTPSSSDGEDMAKFSLLRDSVFNCRGAKSTAIQAMSRFKSNMKVERSSKRSDHNKMEKKRRQELRELYELVRESIPSERFRGGSEKVRTNPSKQQILITAKKYVKQLTKDEAHLKELKRNEKSVHAQRKKELKKLLVLTQRAFQQRH